MFQSKERIFQYLELFIWMLTATAFVGSGLVDFDLGWHLVGGLYILENLKFPSIDPLTINGNFWWNYSWLVEVILALVFKAGGFVGVQILQNIVVVTLVVTLFFCFDRAAKLAGLGADSEIRIIRLIAFVITLFLVFPVAYLRPQLFSIIFFCLLLLWLENNSIKLASVVLLSVVWVNTHVYWVLIPFVLSVYGVQKVLVDRDRKTGFRLFLFSALSFFCGLMSPYGVQNISGIFQYLFNHSAAYGLINEFQPLGIGQGISFWFYVLAIVGFGFFLSKNALKKHLALCFLFFMFAALSLYRMKYLPIFGIIVGFIYVVVLSAGIVCRYQSCGLISNNKGGSKGAYTVAVVLACSYILLCLGLIFKQNILKDEYAELIQITKSITSDNRFLNKNHVKVLTHFDNGGWVALGFWLSKSPGNKESKFKTFIDGRTLVAGQGTIRDFDCLRRSCPDWCRILQNWNFDIAILPRKSSITTLLSNNSACPIKFYPDEPQNQHWNYLTR